MAKCGKVCYPTVAAAQRAMRKVPAKSDKVPLRVYRCGKCKAFHFTSRPRR